MVEMLSYQMFVNGIWVDSSDGSKFPVLNPATGEQIAEVPSATLDDVSMAVEAARESFDKGTWRKMSPGERANIILKIAMFIENAAPELARLETQISGKSIKQTTGYDLPYTVDNAKFLAGASRNLEGKAMGEYVQEGTSAVRREPIGVVGVITPWNYPLMMVVWRAFPAMSMGNSVVVKPASYT
ncbi:MAG: aldehyde dehydrogenase family protein, partial [Thermoplasmatales archaeon]